VSKWPAVDVASAGDPDLVLAIADDFSPTAVEPLDDTLRLFFSTTVARDAAHAAIVAAGYPSARVDIDDEDWARRSQADLKSVTVGRIAIVPWHRVPPAALSPAAGLKPEATISGVPPASGTGDSLVILPSTGFGTGHHATTRLCLKALQDIELTGRSVLDVGTGSGVLALAAVMLGATEALGIDYDADAIRAANENLGLNPAIRGVSFRVADLSVDRSQPANVVTANLTGATLIRFMRQLLGLVLPGGILIMSGLLEDERDEVVRAFARAASDSRTTGVPAELGRPTPMSSPVWEGREDGWVALGICCN
jgi:ribosomal protein L11 methyltransferase